MYLNRIAGFYVGSEIWKEGFAQMTLEEKNEQANEAITARITQLNAVLEKAEQKFRDMKLPKEAWHKFDLSNYYGPGLMDYSAIGMSNRNGQWMLCYAWGTDVVVDDVGDPERYTEWSSKPFRECSMVQRVKMVEELEGLKDKIVEVKEEFVTELDKAIADAAKFLDAN